MNSTVSFTKGLSEVTALWEDEKYDRALVRVQEMRKLWPGNSHLYLLSARLIQLQDESKHTLADAKRMLQQAIDLDKQSPAAAIELGCFLDNVEDDPQSATKAFAQGIAAARQLLIEGLLGQTRSLIQLDNREDAVRCLVDALHLADAEKAASRKRFTERIDELMKELGQMQTA